MDDKITSIMFEHINAIFAHMPCNCFSLSKKQSSTGSQLEHRTAPYFHQTTTYCQKIIQKNQNGTAYGNAYTSTSGKYCARGHIEFES